MFKEKIHVLMSTVFVVKMLKGGSQEKRNRREECKMAEAGAVWTSCSPKIECTQRRSKIENDIAILLNT